MQFLLRALLGKILMNPATKAAVIRELAKHAARTDTKIDDDAVAIFGEIWDIAVPVIVGRV